MKKFLNITTLILLCSCSSIVFTNGKYASQAGSVERKDKWHHVYMLGLLEYSNPVQLNEVCGPGYVWSEVETRKGPLQVVVDFLLPITIVGNLVYSPWSTKVTCVPKG